MPPSSRDRFAVVPASYVFVQREVEGERQVLLQLRSGTGYRDGHWAAAAAGHVEAGESVFDAARREATEELGITIAPEDLSPLTVVHRTQGNGDPVDERVDFFFGCHRWSGRPVIVEPDKAAELEWFSLTSLPAPLVPHEAAVLAALRAGTVPPVMAFGFDEGTSAHTF